MLREGIAAVQLVIAGCNQDIYQAGDLELEGGPASVGDTGVRMGPPGCWGHPSLIAHLPHVPSVLNHRPWPSEARFSLL